MWYYFKHKIEELKHRLNIYNYPDYVVIKGVHINDMAAVTLIKIDRTKETRYTIFCSVTGKEYYKSDIHVKIRSMSKLMLWGRLLSPKNTYPLNWTVINIVKMTRTR